MIPSLRAPTWSLLLLTAALAGAGLAAEPRELGREIDAIFADWSDWDSPGAAVAVIEHGEVIYKRGYGSAQLEYGVPITPATPFHVASVSKQFTCMAIALLALDGALSLDDDVRTYIPELWDYGETITLRHLANHTSGIRDQWELLAMSGFRLDDVITREHILKIVARQRHLNFPVGSEYLYSNSGYTLLAEVVARVSGVSFPEFTAKRIFEPLGMSRTHFHDDHEMVVPGRAYSYAPRDEGWRKAVLSFANAGATSLFTTAEDLARWLDNYRTRTVGGDAAMELMLARGVLSSGDEIDYALGISHGELRGTPVLSHGGADAGFRSFVLWVPEHELGVAVVANLASFDAGGAAQRVAAVVLGDRLQPAPAEADDAAAPEAVDVDIEILNEYVGTYRLVELQAVVGIERRGRALVAVLPDDSESDLVPLSETELLATANSARLRFQRDEGRPAPGFVVALGDQDLRAERVEVVDDAALGDLVGRYTSEELGTEFRLVLEDGRLVARHPRHPDVALVAAADDELLGDQWWFAHLAVERDAEGEVAGFLLSGSRVRNVRFVRR